MATAKSKPGARTETPEIDRALDVGISVAETVVKTNTEAALKGYETLVSLGREALDTACRAGGEVKGLEGTSALPKANFEAIVEAGEAVARGFEAVNGRMFDLARTQIAEGIAAQKALMGAKTFQEALEIQQGFVRKAFDHAVHDGVELSSVWLKVASEAAQPINRRVADAVAEVSKKAA